MADRKLFVNLPVRDPRRSREFFSRLGFELDPKFTDDQAACLVLSGQASVMLLAEPLFRTFTERQVCDTRTHVEALLTVSCQSQAEVDRLVRLAVEGGGQQAGEPQDHGFMYDWGFYDLDGHGWGVAWMKPGPTPG